MLSLPFKVFFNPSSMANTLSLKDVVKTFCTTMDTRKERVMIMHTGNDSVMKFRECCDEIYYFNTSCHDNPKSNRVSNYYLLSTAADNKTYFVFQ